MTDAELLADTNRLLKQFFEWNEEQKAERAGAEEKFKVDQMRWSEEQKEWKAKALREKGLDVDGLDLDDETFKAKFNEIREKSRRQIEEAKKREIRYREELMAELQTQTSLLRQIAEKLGRG